MELQQRSTTERTGESSRKTAVVTGAGGFIGQHLCRRLLDDTWSVRAADLEFPSGLPEDPSLQSIQMDIRDASALVDLVRGADTVFHFASAHLQVRAPKGWYESVNVDAVASLVSACASARVRRLVHVSSVGIYGDVKTPPADENGPQNPVNEYERTKLLGEQAALGQARLDKVDVVILRPGWVYGPGCSRTAKLLRTIHRGRFLYIGDGSNLRHPIYVTDAVDAMLLAARAPASASGRPFLVVGPRAVSVRQLVESCAAVLGVRAPRRSLPRPLMGVLAAAVEVGFAILRKDPPISRRSLAFFDNNNAFDGRAAREELGFSPRVELDEGLRQTVDALGSSTMEPIH